METVKKILISADGSDRSKKAFEKGSIESAPPLLRNNAKYISNLYIDLLEKIIGEKLEE